MSTESVAIEVDPESEIGKLLARAEDAPIVFERNGVRFRLEREAKGIDPGDDPERLRENLHRVVGTLDPAEGERWTEMISRAGEEGSRPSSRPRGF